MTALVVVGVLVAVALSAWAIERHGEHKGEIKTRLAPLENARKMGAIRNSEDSIRSQSARRIAANAHAKADSAHTRAVRADEKYLETRQIVAPVPDSLLSTFPAVAITAIEQRDSALVRADIAVAAIRADAYASRVDAAAQIAVGAVDSTEKVGLKLQIARVDSVADIALRESHPLCGMKCGIVIGGAAVVAVVEAVLHFARR